jgi:hypothetical protein
VVQEWHQKLDQMYEEYDGNNKQFPELTFLEDVLCQSLLPPLLLVSFSSSSSSSHITSRTGRTESLKRANGTAPPTESVAS